ncbi:hypothetical protein KJ564_03355 [bacterium]|nr:hypothetical protein [bacterium]
MSQIERGKRLSPVIENHFAWFSTTYLGGIPTIIRDESAILAFISIFSGIEALAWCRFESGGNGKRFKEFIKLYFPDSYHTHNQGLWALRNGLVHNFSTGNWVLTHHHSTTHLCVHLDDRNKENHIRKPILNAEDFYCALLNASQKYFADVREKPELQEIIIQRLKKEMGGELKITQIHLI